jgi:hypothetical protein
MTSIRVLPIIALCVALTACASQQANPPANTSSGTVTPCPDPPIVGDTCVVFDWTKAQTFVDPQPLLGNAPQPNAQLIPAAQNDPAHYRFTLSNGWMDAYPDWPNLDHLMIHYGNGETIWGKPLYGTPNCANSYTCRQALFNINKGPILEVLTLDGKPVLDSSLLQITYPKTGGVVYLAVSSGRMFAASDLQSLTQQVSQAQQSASQARQSASSTSGPGEEHPDLKAGVEVVTGTLAAVLVLGMAYLDYRAQVRSSYNANNISCTSSEMGNSWYTNCH